MTRYFTPLILTVFLFCLSAITANGQSEVVTEYPEDIISRVQDRYDSMTSLSFSFNQRSQGQMSGRPRTGSGTAIFHKVGSFSRMRWDYQAPEPQVLISDGETFSMYFADLQQMIVTPAARLEDDLTYTFFSGRGKIADSFYILPADTEYLTDAAGNESVQAVKLVPREPQSQVQSIHIWVSADSLIRRIELRDHFDTITLLNLKDIDINGLSTSTGEELDRLFAFTPPDGTEIIHQ